MQVRNSTIGKFVINSDQAPQVPSLNQLSQLSFKFPSSKTSLSPLNVSEMLISKNVVSSPPPTEFKVQNYPLKLKQKGLSGYDWHTDVKNENDLTDKAKNLKPKNSSFQKLFPSSDINVFDQKKSQNKDTESSPVLSKEFNIKHDRYTEYRESMLRAQQMFKIKK